MEILRKFVGTGSQGLGGTGFEIEWNRNMSKPHKPHPGRQE